MKFYALLLLAVALVGFVKAEDTCDIDGNIVKKGEVFLPIGECLQYTCTGKDTYSATNCASESAPDSCKYIEEDKTKKYPDCCPHYDC